jgi:geranylgeranyl diphosphate synthase type I
MQVSQLLNGHPVDTPSTAPARPLAPPDLDKWLAGLQQRTAAVLSEFVRERCAEHVRGVPGAAFLTDLLTGFVTRGKFVRSTFTYLGWLSTATDSAASNWAASNWPASNCPASNWPASDWGAIDWDATGSDAAVRAAASTELVHAFALLQDDVMDRSGLRRGQPAAHVRLASWHRAQGLDGSAEHFGESAAILLADLCLVWAEQLFRDSGLPPAALARAWPRYDTLRGELAVGQFADLVNDARADPTLDEVLDVTRRKSGNYTVRRPLELGAALAGAGEPVLAVLGQYGELVGEAFQLRDDVLGVFGEPDVTGKPSGGDLLEHKATSLVVLAADLASPAQNAELSRLAQRDDLAVGDIDRWRQLIIDTGAGVRIEQMISDRVTAACAALNHGGAQDGAHGGLSPFVRDTLIDLAVRFTDRAH